MAYTLKQIRQAVGQYLDACHLGTISSPGATSFIDAELMDWHGVGENKVANAWVKIVSGAQDGTVRRVSTYDDDTGLVTLTRAWTSPGTASYELHTLVAPSEIERCINRALRRCYYITQEDLNYSSGDWQYDLSDITGLTYKGQVREVHWRTGDDADDELLPLRWWIVKQQATGLVLYVKPWATLESTDGTFVLELALPYAELEDDEDDDTDCPLDWVEAGAVAMVYDLLSRNDPAQDSLRYKQQEAEATARFRRLSRLYQPRPKLHIVLDDSPV